MERGQSETLALIMLIGLVVVSATAVLVVGSSALGAVQEQSESEQRVNELQSVSSSVNDAIYSNGGRTVSGLDSEYEITDGAQIRIYEGGTEKYSQNLGRLERDGVVYEGGMVIDDGRVVSSPNIGLENESTMLRLPRIDGGDSSTFDGEIRHNGTASVGLDPAAEVEIVIESEYYEQWNDQLQDANANVTKDDANERVHVRYGDGPEEISTSLNLGMSDGSKFNLNDIPATSIESYKGSKFDRHNATVGVDADGGNLGGDLSIQGDLRSEGDIQKLEGKKKLDVSGDIESFTDVPEPTPTDELIVDRDTAEDIDDAQEYDRSDGDLEGGVYYTDNDIRLSDVTVEDQTLLVVDGDLILDGTVEVREALDIHVHGSVTLEGSTVETTTPHQSKRVSLFATNDIDVTSDSSFTGMLHSTESTVEVNKGESLTVYGAMTANQITGHNSGGKSSSEFELYYDEDLKGASPYATSRIPSLRTDPFSGYSGNTSTGDATLTYEAVPDDLLVTGDVDAEGATVNGDLLSEGEIDFLRTDVESLAAKGDIDVEEGTIGGNVWIGDGGDLTYTRAEVNGDVFVDGEADIQGGTIRGDVYVNGEVDVNNTEIKGDLIAGEDITLSGGTVDGDVRTGEDLDTDRASIGGEVHVGQEMDFDDGSTGGDIFVGDDAEFNSASADGGSGDLHASGDIDCSGAGLDTIYASDGSEVNCGSGTVSSDSPTEPTVPSDLPLGPSVPDTPTASVVDHYFDVRIADMNVE